VILCAGQNLFTSLTSMNRLIGRVSSPPVSHALRHADEFALVIEQRPTAVALVGSGTRFDYAGVDREAVRVIRPGAGAILLAATAFTSPPV